MPKDGCSNARGDPEQTQVEERSTDKVTTRSDSVWPEHRAKKPAKKKEIAQCGKGGQRQKDEKKDEGKDQGNGMTKRTPMYLNR